MLIVLQNKLRKFHKSMVFHPCEFSYALEYDLWTSFSWDNMSIDNFYPHPDRDNPDLR